MYLGVLLLPLLSFLSVGLFGNSFGRKGSCIITTTLIFITFVLSCLTFSEVFFGGVVSNITLFDWFSIGSFYLPWTFLFDPLTAGMLIVVTSISFLVHLYSTSYMEADPHLPRFMSYLSLFTFFMLCLVTGSNYVQLFLGWEGVGVSSYLLINFWYTRLQANKASLKAIIVNRFGDFGLIIALASIFFVFNSFDFQVIFSLVGDMSNHYIPIMSYEVHSVSLIALFLFLGAVGKSAQLGLHTWLPDAMEGPTPVSALIHAATMVTAGVFVTIRSAPLLEHSNSLLVVVVCFGALTAFFAGTIGIFQYDLKRVIAYSTCSQLGYMVFAAGLSNYSVAMFHLTNHAFFKALLFLSAGSVIHALADEQDMRRMGGLLHLMPYTFVMFGVGSLALMGFPYTTGFFSKDVILELAYSSYTVDGIFSYWMGVLGACCTAFYSYRLLFFTFLGETKVYKGLIPYVHDAPIRMAIPLFVLSLGSIFFGYVFKDSFIGLGTMTWGNTFAEYNSLGDALMLEAEFLVSYIKLFPVFLSVLFGVVALICYEFFPWFFYNLPVKSNFTYYFHTFFSKKWWFDKVYNSYIVMPVLSFGYNVTFKMIDRGLIEFVGPTGIVRTTKKLINFSKNFQSGFFFHYIFAMVLNLIIFISAMGLSYTGAFSFDSSLVYLLLFGVCIFISKTSSLGLEKK